MIMTKDNSAGSWVVCAFLAILFAPLGMFLHAFTASYLWEWFVVTQFGVPSLGLVAAYGLVFTIRFFTKGHRSWAEIQASKDMTSTDHISELFGIMTFTAFVLGMGYVIHLFM